MRVPPALFEVKKLVGAVQLWTRSALVWAGGGQRAPGALAGGCPHGRPGRPLGDRPIDRRRLWLNEASPNRPDPALTRSVVAALFTNVRHPMDVPWGSRLDMMSNAAVRRVG